MLIASQNDKNQLPSKLKNDAWSEIEVTGVYIYALSDLPRYAFHGLHLILQERKIFIRRLFQIFESVKNVRHLLVGDFNNII